MAGVLAIKKQGSDKRRGRISGETTRRTIALVLPLPKTHKKIRDRIRSYQRKLRDELRQFGSYHDGAGRRYLIGPMFLLLDDLDGAIKAFNWYEQKFPDDIGDPGHYLCWTLALYRHGELEAAKVKLRQTMLSNLYVLPFLFGDDLAPHDIWHASNLEVPDYVYQIPSDFFELWSDAEEQWAAECWNTDELTRSRTRYIEIYHQLQSEPVGPTRTQLVREAADLARAKLA